MQPFIVTQAEAGQKLLNCLERRLENGGGELHKWLRTGQVRRNGGRCKAFERVEEGDIIRVPPFAMLRKGPLPEEKEHRPATLDIAVVFENEHVLVLNKPAGLPVQGGTGHADSVAHRLKFFYAGASFMPAPAHRLDKDTSGLLVVGKTYAALRSLTDAMAGRAESTLCKEYLVWVWGVWPWHEEVELRDCLLKDESEHRVKVMPHKKPTKNILVGKKEGKEARAVVRLREQREIAGEPASLLQVRLLTGRTHQIRVQLSSRGFTVVGDPLYGVAREGLKLHAFRLAIPTFTGTTEFLRLEVFPAWPAPWNLKD